MRLQSLELHGFKSFPERTKITFDAGMTVIVGPNGSGKSNISDAVKWVLGELSAKNIRGDKLEDVIFGGTDKRSRMGFAEVSLTIDNTGEYRIPSDYNEITVTRRYFRTGESEYLINGQLKRLSDIVDLFMNTGIGKTGYSIIGQGKISEIIAQRAEDRRYIFEEAAGISKFRAKKQKAERKLAETENNLIRLNDIVSVLEQRVEPLEKDAAKARIYLDLYERKKALDIALAVFDISNIANQNEDFERSYTMAKHSLEMTKDSLQSLNNQMLSNNDKEEENRQKTKDQNQLLVTKKEERHDVTTRRLLAEQELEHGKSVLERYADDIQKQDELFSLATEQKKHAEAVLQQAQSDEERLKEEYALAAEELGEIRATLSDLHKEEQEARNEKNTCEKQLVDDRIRLSALESSQASLAERMQSVTAELDAAGESLSDIQHRLDASKERLTSYRKDASSTQEKKQAIIDDAEIIEKNILSLSEKRNQTRVAINTKTEQAATLTRMEEHFEGYQKSVRFVLDAAASGKLKGICGPISKLIKVENRYSIAIETALGSNIQNIVTEDENAAKAAIAALKKENAGRATFYPLSSVHAEKAKIDLQKAKSFKGYVGIASELLTYDSRYREIIASMLGRTFVFDTLDHATEMARFFGYTVRIVTLDGQQINAGGSYTGGSAKRDSGILSRTREIEALTKEVNDLKVTLSTLEEELAAQETALSAKKDELNDLNDGYLLLAAMYKAEETSHSLILDQYHTQQDAVETLQHAIEHIKQQDVSGAQLKVTLTEEISKLSSASLALDKTILSLGQTIAETESLIAEKKEECNKRMLSITIATKDVEAAQHSYDRCTEEISRIERELALIRKATENKEAGFDILENNIQVLSLTASTLDEEIAHIESQIARLHTEAQEIHTRAIELQNNLKSKNEEFQLQSAHYAKLENKRVTLLAEKDRLTARLWEEYELTYTAACESEYPEITAETRNKSVNEQNKLRSKIRELGPVNVGAIEEYATVKEEYDHLSTQIGDLNKSKEDYANIVSQLEKEMCQKFSESFHAINQNFSVVFRELFGGGSAKLELTDPDHVLTSGIEIIVAPPGKLIKNLKSLSGGEQVFVAIAILFAIFKINPPPFCLLDEIESALDEVNVSRFANYAKNFCNNTQFITISHRRGTMEAANALYGVTMQERGVSKLLSINMTDIEKKIGITLETQSS